MGCGGDHRRHPQRLVHALDGAANLLRERVLVGRQSSGVRSECARTPHSLADGDSDAGHGRCLSLLDQSHRRRDERAGGQFCCDCRDACEPGDERAVHPPGAAMNDALRILPEIILTVAGVLVMVIDALLPKHTSRKSLGWLAVLGALAALAASLWQYQLPPGTAYFGVVQTDAFSVFFHVLIAGIVLASLLITLDAVTPQTEGLGELFALMEFGAVGMM